jgi:PAS domain S-box-containing protein
MFGWTRDEAIGLPLASMIIPVRYRNAHRDGITHYLATGEGPVLNKRLELQALRRGGSEFPIELAVWPLGHGADQTFCAFVRDITDVKRAEAERLLAIERTEASERRLVAAQEAARVGSWEWDVGTGTVTWSDQLYRNFGVEPGTFTPSFETYMGLIHPEHRERVATTIATTLDRMGTMEFDHTVIRPDGEHRVHHCTGAVAVDDDGAVKMRGTSQDITERVRAEEATKQAYEREREMVVRLRQLDRAKTQFVSSVSHELRTPLTSIVGYLELIMMQASDLNDMQQEMLTVIQRNSERLLSLIEDLLTQSKIESGAFQIMKSLVEVAPVVSSAIEAVLPSAAAAGINLDLSISDDVGEVVGDREQLERVMLNLVSNAIKFTPRGSVRVCAERDHDWVVISVHDTGIGIPADEVPNLFSPFFRSSNADSAASGTGLGLVIVKGIVDQHDGTIQVTSRQDEGTTFTVRLPRATSHALTA